MKRKLPPDAFDHYLALGPGGTYEKVAEHFDVSKRAVTKCASRERWQERANAIEQKARERSDQKAVESLAAMDDRHVRSLKAIQGKALQALKDHPLDSAMEGVRALEGSIRLERLIRGQPTGREEVDIFEMVRREIREWMEDEDPQSDGNEIPKATE